MTLYTPETHGMLVDQLTYEQAYAELEWIVGELENDTTKLEDALMLYERGQLLARRCSSLLDQAELRVKQLSGDSLIDFEEEV